MKRILIFSTAYEPFVGGAEIAVREVTNRIPDVEFHMITLDLDGAQKPFEKIGNVSVHRIGKRGRFSKLLFPFRATSLAEDLHTEKKFDATWSIMASYSGFAALFFKKGHPEVPFFLTLQEGDPIGYIKRKVWFVYPWFKQIFRLADRIQVISNYLADFARSMGAKATIRVIPNGVDIPLFTREYPGEKVEDMKKALGKRVGDTFLVTTSRLVYKNGLSTAIRSLRLLPESVRFIVLGTGPLKEKLRAKAEKVGVSSRVQFLGHVAYADIPLYLKASDIFVRPAISEGMGNSFVEAMAAGLPVIATPVGGIPDFLRDGETGLFCGVHNPESVADDIRTLMEDVPLRNKLIENGRKLARERHDWDNIARDMRAWMG